MSLYNITSVIQSNTPMNRGLMEIGGVAIPQAIMSNNRVEAKERFSKSTLFFLATFISPFLTLPILNRAGLKLFKVTEKFWSPNSHIIRISNEFLSGGLQKMRSGIKELSEDLAKKEKYKNIDFNSFINLSDDKLEKVRKNLIKAKNLVFGLDFIIVGYLAGSIPWGVNTLTKVFTKRKGFSAEYGMANDAYTSKKAEKHEKTKVKKYLTFIGITTATATIIPSTIAISLLKNKPKGILNFVQKHSKKFDYNQGIFVKLLPCFLIDWFGACTGELLSCRDNYERRDLWIRIPTMMAVFYVGDTALNNVAGRIIDHFAKTKLVNRETKGLFGSPIRTLDEISKLKGYNDKIISRTKNCAVGMYWSNLALTMLILGFAVPYALNKLLKNNVNKDLEQLGRLNITNESKKLYKDFL